MDNRIPRTATPRNIPSDLRIARVARWVFFVGLANFGAFLVIGLCIGGDAWSGARRDGHYFVSDHGQMTEVSRAVWLYSRVHVCSVFVTHPLALVAGAVLAVTRQANRQNA